VPTLIYINGTNFGSVAGSVSFCTAGGSPCSFSEFLDSTEYLKPSLICPTCFWSNTQIEALVVVDPVDPQADAGTWLMYLNVPFWIAASDASHPSMGEVEMEAPPTVQITSRPITITASSTPGQYVATLTSVASPPGGSYAWTTSNPQMMGFDPSTPPSGPSSDHVKLVITSAGNNATITLTYNGPYGGTAADSFTFALTSDTTVVAWIDGSKIIPDATPLGGPNDIVYQELVANYSYGCVAALGTWRDGGKIGQVGNFTAAERLFANQFLLHGSANNPPPPQNFNSFDYVTGYDYRIFQRLQASYELASGTIISGSAQYLYSYTNAGVSPEPCTGLQLFSLPAQSNARNGERGMASDRGSVYQVNEARLGPDGQAVNFYINGAVGQDYTTFTPWIWSVIQFGANGGTGAWTQGSNSSTLQIFPSYQVYGNGSPNSQFPQGDPSAFISLNSTSQYGGQQ
jgi:hypothetical protein